MDKSINYDEIFNDGEGVFSGMDKLVNRTILDITLAIIDTRMEKEISQRELSRITEVSQSTINRLEKDGSPIKLENLIRILAGLNLKLEVSKI